MSESRAVRLRMPYSLERPFKLLPKVPMNSLDGGIFLKGVAPKFST